MNRLNLLLEALLLLTLTATSTGQGSSGVIDIQVTISPPQPAGTNSFQPLCYNGQWIIPGFQFSLNVWSYGGSYYPNQGAPSVSNLQDSATGNFPLLFTTWTYAGQTAAVSSVSNIIGANSSAIEGGVWFFQPQDGVYVYGADIGLGPCTAAQFPDVVTVAFHTLPMTIHTAANPNFGTQAFAAIPIITPSTPQILYLPPTDGTVTFTISNSLPIEIVCSNNYWMLQGRLFDVSLTIGLPSGEQFTNIPVTSANVRSVTTGSLPSISIFTYVNGEPIALSAETFVFLGSNPSLNNMYCQENRCSILMPDGISTVEAGSILLQSIGTCTSDSVPPNITFSFSMYDTVVASVFGVIQVKTSPVLVNSLNPVNVQASVLESQK